MRALAQEDSHYLIDCRSTEGINPCGRGRCLTPTNDSRGWCECDSGFEYDFALFHQPTCTMPVGIWLGMFVAITVIALIMLVLLLRELKPFSRNSPYRRFTIHFLEGGGPLQHTQSCASLDIRTKLIVYSGISATSASLNSLCLFLEGGSYEAFWITWGPCAASLVFAIFTLWDSVTTPLYKISNRTEGLKQKRACFTFFSLSMSTTFFILGFALAALSRGDPIVYNNTVAGVTIWVAYCDLNIVIGFFVHYMRLMRIMREVLSSSRTAVSSERLTELVAFERRLKIVGRTYLGVGIGAVVQFIFPLLILTIGVSPYFYVFYFMFLLAVISFSFFVWMAIATGSRKLRGGLAPPPARMVDEHPNPQMNSKGHTMAEKTSHHSPLIPLHPPSHSSQHHDSREVIPLPSAAAATGGRDSISP